MEAEEWQKMGEGLVCNVKDDRWMPGGSGTIASNTLVHLFDEYSTAVIDFRYSCDQNYSSQLLFLDCLSPMNDEK